MHNFIQIKVGMMERHIIHGIWYEAQGGSSHHASS